MVGHEGRGVKVALVVGLVTDFKVLVGHDVVEYPGLIKVNKNLILVWKKQQQKFVIQTTSSWIRQQNCIAV